MTFSANKIKEPVIWEMGNRFKVVTNIRQASITDQLGLIAVELEGEESEIEKAIAHAKSRGVTVEPIEKNVIEG